MKVSGYVTIGLIVSLSSSMSTETRGLTVEATSKRFMKPVTHTAPLNISKVSTPQHFSTMVTSTAAIDYSRASGTKPQESFSQTDSGHQPNPSHSSDYGTQKTTPTAVATTPILTHLESTASKVVLKSSSHGSKFSGYRNTTAFKTSLPGITHTGTYTSASTIDTSQETHTTSTKSFSRDGTKMDPIIVDSLLQAHNSKRSMHRDTPPLKWDEALSRFAYSYIAELEKTDSGPCSGVLKHSGGPFGENIGEIAPSKGAEVTDIVDAWYSEIKDYDYNDVQGISHNGKPVGHFTQLVWASTSTLGCAFQRCANNLRLYLICEYNTAGNVLDNRIGASQYDLYTENVKRLK